MVDLNILLLKMISKWPPQAQPSFLKRSNKRSQFSHCFSHQVLLTSLLSLQLILPLSVYAREYETPLTSTSKSAWPANSGRANSEFISSSIKINLWPRLSESSLSTDDEFAIRGMLFEYFADFLPRQYELATSARSSHFPELFEQAFMGPNKSFADTKAAAEVCQILMQVENTETWTFPKILEHYLGIPESLSEEFAHRCTQGMSIEPLNVNVIKNVKSQFLPKQYLFVVGDSREVDLLPFEAWTAIDNATVIVGDRDHFSLRFFRESLIHETAISYDNKSNPDQHWVAEKDVVFFGQESCAALSAINMPIIKAATATLRAMQKEKQVYRELDWPVPGVFTQYLDNGRTCQANLKSMIDSLKAGALTFILKANLYDDFYLRGFCIGDSRVPVYQMRYVEEARTEEEENQIKANNDREINKALAVIHRTEIQTRDAARQPLCDYLTQPELGWEHSASSTGPKPRLTSGW